LALPLFLTNPIHQKLKLNTMKTFNIFSIVAFSVIVFFSAFLSGKTIAQSGTQQPPVVAQPMPAPSIKKQKSQQNSSTAKPSSTTQKESTTASPEKTSGKKEAAAPPLDNKIAISDEGTPSEKTSAKPAPATKRKSSKSTAPVSPK